MTRERVYINDVSPRDGLQIEDVFVATQDKIALIDALSHAGFAKIEATSFVPDEVAARLCDALGLVGTPEHIAKRIMEKANVPTVFHWPPRACWFTVTVWLPDELKTTDGVVALYPVFAGYHVSTL